MVDAYTTNMYPMQGGGWIETVTLTADQKTPTAVAAHYMGDEHALHTMGLKLIAGRNFTAAEIVTIGPTTIRRCRAASSSHKALAEKLFPHGTRSARSIFVENDKPAPIIGIVDRLQGPMTVATGFNSTYDENSVITPYRLIGETNVTWCACSRDSSMPS